MQWLWKTKKIRAKDIHWYEVTKLFDEYKQELENETFKDKEKRR